MADAIYTDMNDATPKTEARINTMLAGPEGSQSPMTLAAAESLTGGNVAARITAISGSSGYFLGSIVAYANEAKAALLGVMEETLATRGAVSAECAREMAEGAQRAFGADLAVATTGIAGPSGATERKPVGLVYIGLIRDPLTSSKIKFFDSSLSLAFSQAW